MTRYGTKDELVNAWVAKRAQDYHEQQPEDNVKLATIEAGGVAVYVPHLYRGGWVIRGFGFSCERIGCFVSAERAGDPCLV